MIIIDIVLILLEVLFAAGLFVLAGYASKVLSSKWKILYVLPAILCMFLASFGGFEISMLGAYIGSCVLLIGFLREEVAVRRIASAAAGVLVLSAVPVCLLNSGYRAPDYEADFQTAFASMKEHYILAEYKGIDWDALYEEYLPKFEAVNKSQDEVENYIVWQEFVSEFYDGHVSFSPTSQDIIDEANQRMYGNDYGLSLMGLSDGRTVAVNVAEGSAAYAAGIHNGTVITAWDGKNVEDVAASVEVSFMAFPDKENEAFYKALLAAGVGGESVTVSFLDEEGTQQSVTLPKTGTYAQRLKDTLEIIDQGFKAGHLTWTAVSEDTAVLRLKEMMYDSESYSSGNHTKMQDEMRKELAELKSQGITNLIIDIRSNGGGSPHMILAIAGLFAEEGEHSYVCSGEWDEKTGIYKVDPETGKYVIGETLTYTGEDLWSDGQIIVLVNAQSISAADHFAWLMGDLDNVTVMGFTKTNGSGQAVGGVPLECGLLSFSSIPTMDTEGNIIIDSDVSHIIGVGVDEIVPFDETAVRVLFDEGGDYLLQKAMEYFE